MDAELHPPGARPGRRDRRRRLLPPRGRGGRRGRGPATRWARTARPGTCSACSARRRSSRCPSIRAPATGPSSTPTPARSPPWPRSSPRSRRGGGPSPTSRSRTRPRSSPCRRPATSPCASCATATPRSTPCGPVTCRRGARTPGWRARPRRCADCGATSWRSGASTGARCTSPGTGAAASPRTTPHPGGPRGGEGAPRGRLIGDAPDRTGDAQAPGAVSGGTSDAQAPGAVQGRRTRSAAARRDRAAPSS